MLEMSAKHHIPQATYIPYQPLLIKPIFSVLAHAEKTVFFKTSLPVFTANPGVYCLVFHNNTGSPGEGGWGGRGLPD